MLQVWKSFMMTERRIPSSKASVNAPNSISEANNEVGEKSYNYSNNRLSQKRNNSRDIPLEDHWHLPQAEKKQLSSFKLSYRSVMAAPAKLRDSLKRMGRSKTLQMIFEGHHEQEEEIAVQSFRELLVSEGQLPEKHDDYPTLLRFLRMRNFDMPKAKNMYLNMLKWRKDCGVDTIAKDFKFEEYEEAKKCYPHGFHGVDRGGRPLYIERIGMLDLNALLQLTTIDRYVKYHISEQEKTVNLRYPACSLAAKRHIASTTAILDVKGVSMKNFSKPARDIFIEIQKIDVNYYPETLHQLFIVNAGSGFRVLWQAIKVFLDPRTLAKVHVLGGQYQSKLVEVIDPSNLPDFLGGKCTCIQYGGCLWKDKGPWTDPEITYVLEDFNKERKLSREAASNVDVEKTSVYDIDDPRVSSTDVPFTIEGHLEQSEETKDVAELLSRKIQALETGLGETNAILQTLLSKQEELSKHVDQLKELAFAVSQS